MNHLLHETSPYLLQHAHNPVNWYPWSEASLEKAKAEDKVILVSIGYAACHWCHVMEKESFEDEKVAALMNENFINIKIDREERPDLDHIYMDAVQAMTGSGGWPLNVFLTPAGQPFYGGTYFPPQKAFNRSSWTEVLLGVKQAWRERRTEIGTQAASLTEHLQKSNDFGKAAPVAGWQLTREQAEAMFDNIMKNADTTWGGFGNAPKFPQFFTIQYLLQYHYFTGNAVALEQAVLSLDKMLEGGIYDQVGGGMARYSTDVEWLAPHFEKMLYDNALLINVLSDAWQLTKNPAYEKAIHKTIGFVQRELMDKTGGFYAALDADSEGEEGKFYVWSKAEIEDILGAEAAFFCAFYDISEAGNWEEKNIPRVLKKATAFAKKNNIDIALFETKMEAALAKLLERRSTRPRPLLDDKILLGWNALMITALCKAAAALHQEEWLQLAIRSFDFLITRFKVPGDTAALYHTFKNEVAKYPAFLDDYAYLVQAAILLQEGTGETRYLIQARELTDHVIDHFSDPGTSFFFFTHEGQSDVIVRKKEVYDGATPSGNSIMAGNLLYLALIFNETAWREQADKMLSSLSTAILKYPGSFGVWAACLLGQAYGINEIVVTGRETAPLRQEVLGEYIPNKVFQSANAPIPGFPLLEGKDYEKKVLAYLCRDYACREPVTGIAALLRSVRLNHKI